MALSNGSKEIDTAALSTSLVKGDVSMTNAPVKAKKEDKSKKKDKEGGGKKRKLDDSSKDSEAVIEELKHVVEDTKMTETPLAEAAAEIESKSDDLTVHQRKRQKKKDKTQTKGKVETDEQAKLVEKSIGQDDINIANVAELSTTTTHEGSKMDLGDSKGTEDFKSETKKKQRGVKKSKKSKQDSRKVDVMDHPTNDDNDSESPKLETNGETKDSVINSISVTNGRAKKGKKVKDKDSKNKVNKDILRSYLSSHSLKEPVSLQTILANLAENEKSLLLDNIMIGAEDNGRVVINYLTR